jgi:hypothetical protein
VPCPSSPEVLPGWILGVGLEDGPGRLLLASLFLSLLWLFLWVVASLLLVLLLGLGPVPGPVLGSWAWPCLGLVRPALALSLQP